MNALLLIRADASREIGTGHVMRCLALAQAWQRAGGIVVFAQAETTPALVERLQIERMETVTLTAARGSVEDAAQTIEVARARAATWIVADGYCFDATWQKQIRDAGLRLLIVDDYGQAGHYHADLVLNQNLGAAESLYARRDPDTQLLLGPRFALLRREFLDRPRLPREIPAVARKILVTLGGSDPENVTGQVITALHGLADTEVVVVVGGSCPHRAALESAVRELPTVGPSVRLVVSTGQMPELMAWADLAVTAAGSTLWEAAHSGLPSLVLVVADNQALAADALHRAGIVFSLGRPGAIREVGLATRIMKLCRKPEGRRLMSALARQLVDGCGAERLIAQLEGYT